MRGRIRIQNIYLDVDKKYARYTIFVCFLNNIVIKNVEICHWFGLWAKVKIEGFGCSNLL
jgi:hypothetical protein